MRSKKKLLLNSFPVKEKRISIRYCKQCNNDGEQNDIRINKCVDDHGNPGNNECPGTDTVSAVPVLFTVQCPWNADACSVVLLHFCQIVSNYKEHDSDNQIDDHRDVHMDPKGDSVAGTYDSWRKDSHEPDQCPNQFGTDIFAPWISTCNQHTEPHHYKQKGRKTKDCSGLSTPTIRYIAGGKMGRDLCRKFVPKKQSYQYRT